MKFDLTKKHGGVPIIGRKPFEPANDKWLTDLEAANFGVNIKSEDDLAAVLGEEKHFCDMCGEEFPLWPIREWAIHFTTVHRDNLTLQQCAGIGTLIQSGMTPQVQQWFGMQLIQRVSIRRRCYELGLISWLPPEPRGGSN